MDYCLNNRVVAYSPESANKDPAPEGESADQAPTTVGESANKEPTPDDEGEDSFVEEEPAIVRTGPGRPTGK